MSGIQVNVSNISILKECDYEKILEKVSKELPVFEYNYTNNSKEKIYIGPSSQEWLRVFPNGVSKSQESLSIIDSKINTKGKITPNIDIMDIIGVTLSCVKQLSKHVQKNEIEIENLKKNNQELKDEFELLKQQTTEKNNNICNETSTSRLVKTSTAETSFITEKEKVDNESINKLQKDVENTVKNVVEIEKSVNELSSKFQLIQNISSNIIKVEKVVCDISSLRKSIHEINLKIQFIQSSSENMSKIEKSIKFEDISTELSNLKIKFDEMVTCSSENNNDFVQKSLEELRTSIKEIKNTPQNLDNCNSVIESSGKYNVDQKKFDMISKNISTLQRQFITLSNNMTDIRSQINKLNN